MALSKDFYTKEFVNVYNCIHNINKATDIQLSILIDQVKKSIKIKEAAMQNYNKEINTEFYKGRLQRFIDSLNETLKTLLAEKQRRGYV